MCVFILSPTTQVTTPMGAEYAIPAAERYAAGIPDPPANTDEFVRVRASSSLK